MRFVVEGWKGPEKGPGPALHVGVPARGEFGCMMGISREPGRKFPEIWYAAPDGRDKMEEHAKEISD